MIREVAAITTPSYRLNDQKQPFFAGFIVEMTGRHRDFQGKMRNSSNHFPELA
jgi:hypothetical protein